MDARSVTGPPAHQPVAAPPIPTIPPAGHHHRGDDAPRPPAGTGCCCCCLPRTSSTSVTESVTGVHDFRVAGYSLLDGMGVGRYVASATFAVAGRDWAVRFYPDGATKDCLGNASAFLYYCNRDDPAGVRARFTLNLMDKQGGRMSSSTSPSSSSWQAIAVDSGAAMRHTFSPASDNWGFIKFVEKSRLHPGSPCIDNDCLTIRCVLTVVKDSRTVATQTNAVVAPPSSLHLDFEKMLNDGEGADVTFTVDGQSFTAHRCVLAYRSPVFRAELFGPMRENAPRCTIPIDDMEPAIFEALLHFIYTDRLSDGCDDSRDAAMQHLLVAADRYGVERLRLVCESKLSEAIDVENVATTLVLAEQHDCSQLRRACIGFMASPNVLGPVMGTEGFKHLIASCPLVMKEILDKVSSVWSDHVSPAAEK